MAGKGRDEHIPERGERPPGGAEMTVKRRGILAAAGAMVAGIVARQAAEPVSAGLGTGTSLTVGQENFGTTPTVLEGREPNPFVPFAGSTVLDVTAYLLPDTIQGGSSPYNVDGIHGTGKGTAAGVVGYGGVTSAIGNPGGPGVVGSGGGTTGVGVAGYGATSGVGGTGVFGQCSGGPQTKGVHGKHTGNGYGVYGEASTGGYGVTGVATTALGVYGQSTSGTGVLGQSGGDTNSKGVYGKSTVNGYGVYGEATTTNGYGVQGIVTNGDATARGVSGNSGSVGYGVYGTSTNGYGVYGTVSGGFGVGGYSNSHGIVGTTGGTGMVAGVYGTSSTAYGIIGNTSAAGYSGLTAITGTAGVAALAATSTVPTAFAAYFTGATVVQGDFTVFGGAKSAAVPHSDGSHRVVYCVESPESWFEDVGKAKLVNGKADVKLDADFAAIVHADDYHVFLTSYGASQGLDVVSQSGAGFSVQERNKGGSTLTFSWRVMAKRKDITGERLAKFDLPKIKAPDLAALAKHELPKPDTGKKA